MPEQLELFTITNPCIGTCEVNNRGFCRGCMRSRTERYNWENMSSVEKRTVIRLCAQRRLRMERKKIDIAEDNDIQGVLF